MKLLLYNGYQHIGRHDAPDFRLNGILAVDQELLDSQVLLDPFEEQFDMPAIPVNGSNSQQRQGKIAGQKYERLATLRFVEPYTHQIVWVILSCIKPVEYDGLIAYEPCGSVDLAEINSSSIRVGVGACYEKSAHLMQPVKSGEIQIAAVHYEERSCYDWKKSSTLTSCILPSLIWINAEIAPLRSNRVCSLTVSLVLRNGAP